MRIFRHEYTDRDGKTRKTPKWYIDFRDPNNRKRRIPGYTDKRLTQRLADRVERLIAFAELREPPDPGTTAWLEAAPTSTRESLTKAGLLDRSLLERGRPAPAKVMQELARHSTVELTIGRYTHAGLFDLASAVDRVEPPFTTPAATRGCA